MLTWSVVVLRIIYFKRYACYCIQKEDPKLPLKMWIFETLILMFRPEKVISGKMSIHRRLDNTVSSRRGRYLPEWMKLEIKAGY